MSRVSYSLRVASLGLLLLMVSPDLFAQADAGSRKVLLDFVKAPEPALLNDAVLAAALPLLRLNAAALDQSPQAALALEQQQKAYFALREKIEQGGVDALTWTKAQTTHVDVPPNARYLAGCSRAMNVPGALFTLGESLPAGIDLSRPNLEMLDRLNANPVFRAAFGYYTRARGWRKASEDESFGSISFVPIADSTSVVITVLTYNQVKGLRPDCSNVPNGPVIVIAPVLPETDFSKFDGGLPAAAAKAGLDKDDVSRLIVAFNGARAEYGMLAELETELKTRPGDKDLPVRIANAKWYARHAAVLDPLLKYY